MFNSIVCASLNVMILPCSGSKVGAYIDTSPYFVMWKLSGRKSTDSFSQHGAEFAECYVLSMVMSSAFLLSLFCFLPVGLSQAGF